jgi:two-component system, NarL family, response regulator LiaR
MTAHRPLRVLLVDDHAMVRRGLAAFLKTFDDLELAGEAATGEEAVQRCAEAQPDVVLMDLMLPVMDGVAATRAIRERFPTVRIIALTSFREEGLVHRALQAGAIGYLLKNVSAEELAAAIRAAHAGRSTLAPEATQALVQAAVQPPVPGQDLSPREREVLALLVEGLNNRAIAARLVVSLSTAKAHVSNVLTKLGVTSRTEAVALAMRHHLVT